MSSETREAVASQAIELYQEESRLVHEATRAKNAAAQLAASLPHKSPYEIVEDLLHRLRSKRAMREKKGLNHWEKYYPRYLERLAAKHRVGEPLRQMVRFIVLNHDQAVEFARRISRDSDLAEDAVSQTYIELLRGRTTVPLYYRALKMNARDLMKCRARELRRFESFDGFVSAAKPGKFSFSDEIALDSQEEGDLVSGRLDDQNPEDILIAQEEARERSDELDYALVAARYRANRWILRTKWWRESAIGEWEKRHLGGDLGGHVE